MVAQSFEVLERIMTKEQSPLFEAAGLMLSVPGRVLIRDLRSEEHTSELQ